MLLKVKQKKFDDKQWSNVKTEKLEEKSYIGFVSEEFEPATLAIYQNNKLKCVISNNEENRDFYIKKDILFLTTKDTDLLYNGKIGINAVTNIFKDTDFVSIDYMEPVKE